MSRHFEAMISVTLQSPFIMAGEEPSQYGVDVAQLRDRNRRPLIPAAQIRGVARHGWRYLEEEDVTLPKGSKTVFGSEGGRVACDPGKVVFSDLVARSNGKNSAITRVAIDDQFGAGKDGSLMTVELAAPIGQEVTFDGIVRIDDVTPDEAALIVGGLTQSLGCVIAIGRFKTVGFGEVTAVEVKNLRPIVEPTAIAVAGVTTDLDLTFGLDRPLLVDIDRPDDNSLRGREVIPGSVLKGALARRLAEDGQSPDAALTAKVLSTMVIGHAFPAVNCDSFGAATPLDFARQKTDSTKKHWRVLFPALSFTQERQLPRFAPDWKEDDYKVDQPRAEAFRVARTRVAIEATKGAAKKGALFATAGVGPDGIDEKRSTDQSGGRPGSSGRGRLRAPNMSNTNASYRSWRAGFTRSASRRRAPFA